MNNDKMNKHWFLSCDWGTSSFRLRLVDAAAGQVLAATASTEGIADIQLLWKQQLAAEGDRVAFYSAVIQKNISAIELQYGSKLDGLPVVISGMASASIGMIELPYRVLPFSVNGSDLQYKRIKDTSDCPHERVIVSGAATAADVMRGEETQLVGCAGAARNDEQLFIFTGTHSKHVTVTDGWATGIVTYMTGEFFALLSRKSILANSVVAGNITDDAFNGSAFEQGLRQSLEQNILHTSFMVRTNQLFKKMPETANYFYLSGLLIGTELQYLLKKDRVAISVIGDETLLANYRSALHILGIAARFFDAERATVEGQLKIYNNLYGR